MNEQEFKRLADKTFQMMYEHLFYAKLNSEAEKGRMSEKDKQKTFKMLAVFKRHGVGIADAMEIISELGDVLGE